jgi:hypothetical protein
MGVLESRRQKAALFDHGFARHQHDEDNCRLVADQHAGADNRSFLKDC